MGLPAYPITDESGDFHRLIRVHVDEFYRNEPIHFDAETGAYSHTVRSGVREARYGAKHEWSVELEQFASGLRWLSQK